MTNANPCAGFEPIYPTSEDNLTRETKEKILSHDLYGTKRCGWGKAQ